MASLGKQLWKALNDTYSNWVKILKARNFNRRKMERFDGRPLIGSSTFVFGDVVKILGGVMFNYEDGNNIRFWVDIWIDHMSLAAGCLPFIF